MTAPDKVIQNTGRTLIRKLPSETMIAVVIVKATKPDAKTIHGLIFVARARIRSASLSVNSAMNTAVVTVSKAEAISDSCIPPAVG